MKNYYIFFIKNCKDKIIEKINFLIKDIREKALNLRISIKFVLFYFILFIFSISLSNLLFQRINSRILENKIGDASIQTLSTISSSIDSLFENINNYSKMILSNEDIQKTLTHNSEYIPGTLLHKSGYFDFQGARKVDVLLESYIEAMPNIASIYLFDNNGNKYAVDRQSVKNLKCQNIEQADWYNEVVKKKGRYIITVNAGGIFEEDNGKKYISFIRIINDFQNYKPIGVMIINVSVDTLKTTYNKAVSGNKVYIAVFDKGNTVVDFDNAPFSTEGITSKINENNFDSEILKIDKKLFLVSTVTSKESYLRFVSVIPFNEVMSEYHMFDLIAFFIILLNSIFLFIGTIFITRLITIPIKKLIESMKKAEKGEFIEVYIRSGDDEIGELRDGYNAMVSEIRNLIEKIMMEQKIKRKAELNILQEQIKPHFLYNSLDAIAYMAVAGKGDEAYNLIMALSNYYRTSLSKGSEVITIYNEVEIVRNYLSIQKVRYPNLFIDEYGVDESIGEVKIVKLILQPLVENALYHGIKPKGESGKIRISVKKEDKCIKLSVEDDGVGINEEKLRKINSSELDGNISSFGLRGTIERLKIFYGIENIYEITSEEGYGTKINITLPINLEDFQN